MITNSVSGRVEIGAIRGNVINHLVVENLRITDSAGLVLVEAPRVEIRYSIPQFLAGRIVLTELRVDRGVVHLVRDRENRWNYERVFRSAKSDTLGPPPQLVELRNVTLRDASIRIDVPANPQPPRLAMSRNATAPAQPRLVAGRDGPLRVYQLSAVYGRLPLVRVSTPRRDPLLVRIDELRTRLSDPAVTITSAKGEITTSAIAALRLRSCRMPGTWYGAAGW